ncbi:hypothetical protein CCACVL1_30517 [Corchorus capsularis]|uniref:Uncharacterized protein n=1 Tax=Corchorus capsularis TaxID=210143 RepID=A0A1R3FWU2_COCAP|nr:hypothetical protein CCACVL1_30517 [Corchorus capsularis]
MTRSPTPNSTKDKPSELCNWFEEKKSKDRRSLYNSREAKRERVI